MPTRTKAPPEEQPALLRDRLQTESIKRKRMGYSPEYGKEPFVDFASITPKTDVKKLNLDWRERDLPERVRTKHVHRLHPYLGKYIPQLVEIFLRKFQPTTVCDPFGGSGTTLVEAKTLGINAVGCDISAFNCLLAKVKTDTYDVEKLDRESKDIIKRLDERIGTGLFSKNDFDETTASEFLRKWFHADALRALLCYRSLIPKYEYKTVFKVILSRAARSARLTTHFDLDFPKKPQTAPYFCYKHARTCKPTDNALQFLYRYTENTVERIREFSTLAKKSKVQIFNADSRTLKFPRFDMIMTSPPYVGLIDYHEQHRYAYELLGLPIKATEEIGAASNGSSANAQRRYVEDMIKVFTNLRKYIDKKGVAVVVVNDKHGIYGPIAAQSGFAYVDKVTRHVNRRTGRRSTDFFEDVLIWKPA